MAVENITIQKLFSYSALGVKIKLKVQSLTDNAVVVNPKTNALLNESYVILFSSGKVENVLLTLVEDNCCIFFTDKNKATQYVDKLMRVLNIKVGVGEIVKHENN